MCVYILYAVKDNTTLRVQQLWYWTFGQQAAKYWLNYWRGFHGLSIRWSQIRWLIWLPSGKLT